jgi:hypothetical protein
MKDREKGRGDVPSPAGALPEPLAMYFGPLHNPGFIGFPLNPCRLSVPGTHWW